MPSPIHVEPPSPQAHRTKCLFKTEAAAIARCEELLKQGVKPRVFIPGSRSDVSLDRFRSLGAPVNN